MNKALLLSYQIEYQTTTISREDLEEKYEAIPNNIFEKWNKPEYLLKRIEDSEDIIDESEQTIEVIAEPEEQIVIPERTIVTKPEDIIDEPKQIVKLPPIEVVTEEKDPKSKEVMMEDIVHFKRELLTYCQNFINKDSQYAEVKEIKDVAKIVTDLEDSFKDKGPESPTVNVLIQNITQGFKDDC